tara:strand:- start:7 stop:231 length:225 start_codon:yes stop_codon:yes gene_type:complete
MAADNARSRDKTGLPPLDGDDDLIEYYYFVLHPNTTTTFDMRKEGGKKKFRTESLPRLRAKFGDHICSNLDPSA